MTAPVDAGRAGFGSSVSATSHAVTLPGSISSGDYLFMVLRSHVLSTFTITGWTQLATSNVDAATGDDRTSIWYKVASGSEGATQTVSITPTARLSAVTFRVTGAAGDPLVFGGVGATNAAPNITSGTYALSNADVLILAMGGVESALTASAGPSGYANLTTGVTSGGGTNLDTACFGATLQKTGATSEDPGAFTLPASEDNTVWGIAIQSGDATNIRMAHIATTALVQSDVVPIRMAHLAVTVLVKTAPANRPRHASFIIG